jgi:hypothetical protein
MEIVSVMKDGKVIDQILQPEKGEKGLKMA